MSFILGTEGKGGCKKKEGTGEMGVGKWEAETEMKINRIAAMSVWSIRQKWPKHICPLWRLFSSDFCLFSTNVSCLSSFSLNFGNYCSIHTHTHILKNIFHSLRQIAHTSPWAEMHMAALVCSCSDFSETYSSRLWKVPGWVICSRVSSPKGAVFIRFAASLLWNF